MMVALRHFLRFIELEEGFEKHGFNIKVGDTHMHMAELA